MSLHRRAAARATVLAALASAAALGLAGCGSGGSSTGGPASPAPGTLDVVATTDVYGSVVRAVGGPHVTVDSIIHSPDADPHEYESTPADAAAVGRAALLIENGGGYDDFAGKLVSATRARATVIDVSRLSGLDTGADFNEHVFYHLPTMATLADTVATDLGRADPAHGADYRAGAAAFRGRLAGLTAKVEAIKAAHTGARIAVTEPVPLYLTTAAGLVDATPEAFSHAVEEGNDPPAAVLQQTLAQFSGPDQVSALLLNAQTESPLTTQVEQAATAAGVPVVKVTETLPAGTMDYVTWMDGQLDQLAGALGRHQ
jgi:zinc/manganese transport system substrate-binding protein